MKWLDRIGVLDTPFMGHFMARDYVTIREEQRDGQPVWTETSVGKALLKSAPARVTRTDGAYRSWAQHGAPGSPVSRSESTMGRGSRLRSTRDPGPTAPGSSGP